MGSSEQTAMTFLQPQGDLQRLRVAAVVVSYNRRDLLQETLQALLAQTVRPDAVIVVDNGSTDDAAAVAAHNLEQLGAAGQLIKLQHNTGGAGGFAVGIAAAINTELEGFAPDWVWVMDDDTVPHPTALETALHAHREYAATGPDSLAVIGSRVVWTNGQEHPMNTPKQKIGVTSSEVARSEAVGATAIRSISFVSALLRTSRIQEVGLPVAAYFLWNDDFEYSARLLHGAHGIYVPRSVVTHKTKALGSSDHDPGERFRYEVRNKIWLFKHSRALKPWERAAYRAATARRWVRTFKRSSAPVVLARACEQGLKEAYRAAPLPNSMVLQGAGVPQDVATVIAALDPATASKHGRWRR